MPCGVAKALKFPCCLTWVRDCLVLNPLLDSFLEKSKESTMKKQERIFDNSIFASYLQTRIPLIHVRIILITGLTFNVLLIKDSTEVSSGAGVVFNLI